MECAIFSYPCTYLIRKRPILGGTHAIFGLRLGLCGGPGGGGGASLGRCAVRSERVSKRRVEPAVCKLSNSSRQVTGSSVFGGCKGRGGSRVLSAGRAQVHLRCGDGVASFVADRRMLVNVRLAACPSCPSSHLGRCAGGIDRGPRLPSFASVASYL